MNQILKGMNENFKKKRYLRSRSEGLIPNSSLKHFVKYEGAEKPTS